MRWYLFSRISTIYTTLTTQVSKIAKHPSSEYTTVESILILTQQPLIPYLSRDPLVEQSHSVAGCAAVARMEGSSYTIDDDETLCPWEQDGPFAYSEGESAIVGLIAALLRWKRGSIGRDAIIISTLDIKVTYSYIHSHICILIHKCIRAQTYILRHTYLYIHTYSFMIHVHLIYSTVNKRMSYVYYISCIGASLCCIQPQVCNTVHSSYNTTHCIPVNQLKPHFTWCSSGRSIQA